MSNSIAGNQFYNEAAIVGHSLTALTGLKTLNLSGIRDCAIIGQSFTALIGLRSLILSGEGECMM